MGVMAIDSSPNFKNHFTKTWYVRISQFAAILSALIDGAVIVDGGPRSSKTGFSLLLDEFLINMESF